MGVFLRGSPLGCRTIKQDNYKRFINNSVTVDHILYSLEQQSHLHCCHKNFLQQAWILVPSSHQSVKATWYCQYTALEIMPGKVTQLEFRWPTYMYSKSTGFSFLELEQFTALYSQYSNSFTLLLSKTVYTAVLVYLVSVFKIKNYTLHTNHIFNLSKKFPHNS